MEPPVQRNYCGPDTLKLIFFSTIALIIAWPSHSFAHVKWFCGPIDLRRPPIGLGALLSPTFRLGFISFLVLVSAGAITDAFIEKRRPSIPVEGRRREVVEAWIIRIGVGGYCICLWHNMAMVPWARTATGTILAPELLDKTPWVSLLQLFVAVMVVFRRTCAIAALGLTMLFGIGVVRYGLFHMVDYTYFLGLAGYLALSSPRFDNQHEVRRWRTSIAVGSLSLSLMWTAIEKFLYPAWMGFVLALHPHLTLGFSIPFVTVIAGFVEFSLAFYLLVGRNLLRINAFLLILLFVAAIPEFGEMDRIGHLPIIAIFLVIMIHGSTPLQQIIQSRHANILNSVISISMLYVIVFVIMTTTYYSLQKLSTLV